MKTLLTSLSIYFLCLGLQAQSIEFVKDSLMDKYMKSGFASKHFVPLGNYDEEGKRTGMWKDYFNWYFYANIMKEDLPVKVYGSFLLYGEGIYKGGERDSIWTVYTIEDKTFNKFLHSKTRFKDGTPQGPGLLYYPDGSLAEKGTFLEGLFEGPLTRYYPDGKVFADIKFESGKWVGTHTYRYPDGGIKLQQSFIEDKNHGNYISYYRNGQLKCKTFYKLGEYHGKYSYYYENGQLWVERIYKNGLLLEVNGNYTSTGEEQDKGTLKNGTGTVKFYSEEGKLYLIHTYKEGKLESKEELGKASFD